MERIYYWEHVRDESRYLRSHSAHTIAEVAHAQPESEVGVLIDAGDDAPLEVRTVERRSSLKQTARALASA